MTTVSYRARDREVAVVLASRLTSLGFNTDVTNDPSAARTRDAVLIVATGDVGAPPPDVLDGLADVREEV